MDQLFNQVEQTRAYNIDNLIGEIGGYLGLFLGYALAQIPSTILFLVNCIQKVGKRHEIKCQKKLILSRVSLIVNHNNFTFQTEVDEKI